MYRDVLVSTETTVSSGRKMPVPWAYPPMRPHIPSATDTLFWRTAGILERMASAFVLLLLSPVCIAAAITIWFLSGQSPFLAVLRSGRYGSPLWVLKLRTMWHGAPMMRSGFRLVEHVIDEEGPLWKDAADVRISNGFARFCRRFSLDEIPQLLQVVLGEMSLVAPRPLTSSELREHYGDDAPEVLSVRPGITGLWQVSGRNALTYPERRNLDLILVRSLTPRLYLRILARTVPVVFTGKSSW